MPSNTTSKLFSADKYYIPRGLFLRVIKRLGLEKELVLIKKHLGFFSGLLAIFLVLSIFAVIGARQVLAKSSFGPLISLIFSDPGAVIKYWRSFMLSVFESAPAIFFFVFLFALSFLMLFLRFAGICLEKLLFLLKSVRK